MLLRNATTQVHKDLEAMPVSKIIMSPELTVAVYIDYLCKVYAIHYSIENSVFPVLIEKIADVEKRKKIELIIHDLKTLQASIPLEDSFLDADFRDSVPFCMGMLYVSEGSTLGGQYILKNIQKVLGAQAADATTFLNAYGPRTGSMWKAFTDILSTYDESLSEAEMKEVAAGAVYGFERTSVVFSRILDERNK